MKEETYISRGESGPNLVFLHYFGGEAGSWQWVMPYLENEYRCFALNLPGFGETSAMEQPNIIGMAQWAIRQLALLDIYDFTLIGHSMGGKIALQMAAMPSEMEIHRLILFAPSPPTYEPMPDEEKERMLQHPDIKVAAQTVSNATMSHLDEEKRIFATQTQLEVDAKTWKWWLKEGMNDSIAEAVQGLIIPVHVITSEDDPVITMDVIRQEVMPVLPKVKLITTQGSGHLLPLESPKWLTEQIKALCPLY